MAYIQSNTFSLYLSTYNLGKRILFRFEKFRSWKQEILSVFIFLLHKKTRHKTFPKWPKGTMRRQLEALRLELLGTMYLHSLFNCSNLIRHSQAIVAQCTKANSSPSSNKPSSHLINCRAQEESRLALSCFHDIKMLAVSKGGKSHYTPHSFVTFIISMYRNDLRIGGLVRTLLKHRCNK